MIKLIFYFDNFYFFFSLMFQAKFVSYQILKILKVLKKKLKFVIKETRLYLTYDIKIKTEKLIVNLCSLKDTIISKEEINIVHKRNSGVSLICIYEPYKNFLINFIVRNSSVLVTPMAAILSITCSAF